MEKKIVIHTRTGRTDGLERLVAAFIRNGVRFVGVVGPDCSKIEEEIDELCVGDGSNTHYMLTSSHPNETLEEAVAFARSLAGEFEGEVELVELTDDVSETVDFGIPSAPCNS